MKSTNGKSKNRKQQQLTAAQTVEQLFKRVHNGRRFNVRPYVSEDILASEDKMQRIAGFLSSVEAYEPHTQMGTPQRVQLNVEVLGQGGKVTKSRPHRVSLFLSRGADKRFKLTDIAVPNQQLAVSGDASVGAPTLNLIRNIRDPDEVFDAMISAVHDVSPLGDVNLLAQYFTPGLAKRKGFWPALYEFYSRTQLHELQMILSHRMIEDMQNALIICYGSEPVLSEDGVCHLILSYTYDLLFERCDDERHWRIADIVLTSVQKLDLQEAEAEETRGTDDEPAEAASSTDGLAVPRSIFGLPVREFARP